MSGGGAKRQVDDLALYHHELCGFCQRVRSVLARLGVEVELRDIRQHPEHREALVEGGGKQMVPCLRISKADEGDTWLYESADIIDYLVNRFGDEDRPRAGGNQ